MLSNAERSVTSVHLNMSMNFFFFPQAQPRFDQGGIRAIIDRRMDMGYNEDLYTDMANLALRCVEHERLLRPTMKVGAWLPVG